MFGKKCFGGNITLAKTLAIVCILIACLMPVFLYLEADWKALWNVVSVQISPYSVDQMTYSAELCLCVLACIYITDVASAYQLFYPLQYSQYSTATRSILKLLSQWKVAEMGNDCPGGKVDCVRKSSCLQLSPSAWPEFEPSLFRLFD